jgi:hypothetical protein
MPDRAFRVRWADRHDPELTPPVPTYRHAKLVADKWPDAQIEVCEWSQHWPCCAHRIGTCPCDGGTCCLAGEYATLAAALEGLGVTPALMSVEATASVALDGETYSLHDADMCWCGEDHDGTPD